MMRAADAAAGVGSGQGLSVVGSYLRKDPVYISAKKAGYRSRAAFKLEDLDRRYHILSAGARVVDLGCWPGGWLQIASERVGGAGMVIGVDLEPVEDLALANVRTIVGDIRDQEVRGRVRDAIGHAADVVLSDMAPKLTGVKVADRERHLGLIEIGIDFGLQMLCPRGSLVIKLFSGVEHEATSRLKRHFRSVAKYRPASSRKGSSELYAIANDRRLEPTKDVVG